MASRCPGLLSVVLSALAEGFQNLPCSLARFRRVEFPTEEDVEAVNGEGQFAESPGCVRIDLAGFDAAAGAFETQAQSDVLILISECAKQPPNLLRASVCLLDGAQRRDDGGFFRQRGLEQSAVELPATLSNNCC